MENRQNETAESRDDAVRVWKKRRAWVAFGSAIALALTFCIVFDGLAARAVRAEELPGIEKNEELIDQAAFTGEGMVSTFLDGSFYKGTIKNEEDAEKAMESLIEKIGGDDSTILTLSEIIPTETGTTYYTFYQYAGGVRVFEAVVKLIVDQDGKAVGLVSDIVPNLKNPEPAWEITGEDAEAFVEDRFKNDGLRVIKGATQQTLLPIEDGSDQMLFVWVVYTPNPDGTSEMGYLAHYISEDGNYMYSQPVAEPGNAEALAGSLAPFSFDGTSGGTWTGTVTHFDGTDEEISIPVMVDNETGQTVLADPERKILCADYSDYTNEETLSPLVSDNDAWSNAVLLLYSNFIKIWDFYDEMGWTGPDGEETPVLVLFGYEDKNASYMGKLHGFQTFVFNELSYYDCVDVIAHEFTHCVTMMMMSGNRYQNDSGAINEAFSDIMGNLAEMMIRQDDKGAWIHGENTGEVERSFVSPQEHEQPASVWGDYYTPGTAVGTAENDNGGVHSNSSLLNRISYLLDQEGMAPEDQAYFWINTSLAMTPRTDYPMLAKLLPWSMKNAGYTKYVKALNEAIKETGVATHDFPDELEEGCGIVTVEFPFSDYLENYDIVAMIQNQEDETMRVTWPSPEFEGLCAVVPEGDYTILVGFTDRENTDGNGPSVIAYTDADGWHLTDDMETAEQESGIFTVPAGKGFRMETDTLYELLG